MKKAFGAVPGMAMMQEGELRRQALTAASQRERLKRMLTSAEVKEEIAGKKVTTVKEVVKLIMDGTRALLKKEVGEHDADTRIAQFYDMICTVTAAEEVEADSDYEEEEEEHPRKKTISKQRLQIAQQSDAYCTAMRKHLQSGGEWLPKEEKLARQVLTSNDGTNDARIRRSAGTHVAKRQVRRR